MPHNGEKSKEYNRNQGDLLKNKFYENLKKINGKTVNESGMVLSGQEKYDKVKKIMEEREIDEFSLEGAKLFIENGLGYYVVAIIKDFPKEIHDNIVDLLLLNHEGHILEKAPNWAADFQVDANRTLYKLYYTNQGKKFLNIEITERDPLNKSINMAEPLKNEIKGLKEFEGNSIIRKLIIDELKKNEDGYLEYLFKYMRINDYRDLFTEEEIAENQELMDRLEKILK